MEAKELMLKDLIYDKDKVVQVYDVRIGYGEQRSIGVWLDKLGVVYPSDERLAPIPLTPEILPTNGFRIDASMRFLNHEEFSIEYSLGDAYTRIFYKGTIIHKHMNYVHELQHALRLCGLNELADNFKVM